MSRESWRLKHLERKKNSKKFVSWSLQPKPQVIVNRIPTCFFILDCNNKQHANIIFVEQIWVSNLCDLFGEIFVMPHRVSSSNSPSFLSGAPLCRLSPAEWSFEGHWAILSWVGGDKSAHCQIRASFSWKSEKRNCTTRFCSFRTRFSR